MQKYSAKKPKIKENLRKIPYLHLNDPDAASKVV
jgi:hypothetical protein